MRLTPSAPSRPRTLALVALGGLLLLLVLAQLLLPWIAASRISSRIGRYGHVDHVSVSAWPAIELLWGDADKVDVRAGSLSLSPSQAAHLLWEGRGVSHMDFTASAVRVGSLRLTDATLTQRGHALRAAARASQADVSSALPAGLSVRLLRSEGGQVEVLAGGGLFGVGASVRALALAQGGALVAHPVGVLPEGFTLTLFADPHVSVTGVGASELPTQPPSYRLTITGTLH
jgi:hypothetical protein